MVGRLTVSPVVPDISIDLGISNTLIGFALTGMWFAYAITQFPSGLLADRYDETAIILVSIAGTGISTVVIAVSPKFSVFVLGMVLLGVTTGLHYTVGTALLTRTYDNVGTAVGIHNSGAPVAGLLTPIAVSWVASSYGWRPAIGLTALLAVPVFALFYWRIQPPGGDQSGQSLSERIDLQSVQRLLSRPTIVFTGVIAILFDFTWQSIASFLPTFFVQYQRYSQTLAGGLFAAYFVSLGVLQVLVGIIADRFTRDVAIGVYSVTGIAALLLLVVGTGLPSMAAAVILLGFAMGWGPLSSPGSWITSQSPNRKSASDSSGRCI